MLNKLKQQRQLLQLPEAEISRIEKERGNKFFEYLISSGFLKQCKDGCYRMKILPAIKGLVKVYAGREQS